MMTDAIVNLVESAQAAPESTSPETLASWFSPPLADRVAYDLLHSNALLIAYEDGSYDILPGIAVLINLWKTGKSVESAEKELHALGYLGSFERLLGVVFAALDKEHKDADQSAT